VQEVPLTQTGSLIEDGQEVEKDSSQNLNDETGNNLEFWPECWFFKGSELVWYAFIGWTHRYKD